MNSPSKSVGSGKRNESSTDAGHAHQSPKKQKTPVQSEANRDATSAHAAVTCAGTSQSENFSQIQLSDSMRQEIQSQLGAGAATDDRGSRGGLNICNTNTCMQIVSCVYQFELITDMG